MYSVSYAFFKSVEELTFHKCKRLTKVVSSKTMDNVLECRALEDKTGWILNPWKPDNVSSIRDMCIGMNESS